MAEKQADDNGRKSARAKSATKVDDEASRKSEAESSEPGGKAVKKAEEAGAKLRGSKGSAAPEADTKKPTKIEEQEATKREVEPEKTPLEKGEQFLEGLFERMRLNLDIASEYQGDRAVYNLTGEDADEFVGRSHETPKLLKAVQTMVAESLGREMKGKVSVDVGGFKEKRSGRLDSVADQLGEAAEKTGRSIEIAGLNSYERRVVHQRLADRKGVDTESVDKGIFRKLRVLPK